MVSFDPNQKSCAAFQIIRNGGSFSESDLDGNSFIKPLQIEPTPTNLEHQRFLESLEIIGLTNHLDLFKNDEEEEQSDDQDEIAEDQVFHIERCRKRNEILVKKE